MVGGACPAPQVGSATVPYGIPPCHPQVGRIVPCWSWVPIHCKHRRPRAVMLQSSYPAAYFGSRSPKRLHVALGHSPTKDTPVGDSARGSELKGHNARPDRHFPPGAKCHHRLLRSGLPPKCMATMLTLHRSSISFQGRRGWGLIGQGSGAWCSHAWVPGQWAWGAHLGVVSAAVRSLPRVRTSQNGHPLQGWSINFRHPCAPVAGGAARLRRPTCEGSWPDPNRVLKLAPHGTCRGRLVGPACVRWSGRVG